MGDVTRVLIVGGGFAGMAAAIRMARHGMQVHLVERDESWGAHGAGISLNGATLRALRDLGLLEQVMAQGFCEGGCNVCGADGTVFEAVATPPAAPGVPGGGAIMRPTLARIMAQATREAGVNVRLGMTYTRLDNTAGGVHVTFADGGTADYDIVVGADGLYSGIRSLFWPGDLKPEFTGQGVWRATLPRPADLHSVHLYRGYDCKIGLNPVSADWMYMFLVENKARNTRVSDATRVDELAALMAEFSDAKLVTIRNTLGEQADVNYRPLEAFLLQHPWYDKRIVLIGDAVHATTPHLASGAGLGIEGGMVLADELAKPDDGSIEHALQRYQARRWERSRMVVENSLRLGEIEKEHGSEKEYAEVIGRTMQGLVAPI